MDTTQKNEIANKLAQAFGGNAKVWTGGNTVRVYVQGFATIMDDGTVNIDAVKRSDFGPMKAACETINVKYTR